MSEQIIRSCTVEALFLSTSRTGRIVRRSGASIWTRPIANRGRSEVKGKKYSPPRKGHVESPPILTERNRIYSENGWPIRGKRGGF